MYLQDKENTPCGRKKLKKIRKDVCFESKTNEKEAKDIPYVMERNLADNVTSCKVTDLYQTADFPSGDYRHEDESDSNIYANDVLNFGCNSSPLPSVFKEPPPLPPKPKNIAWRFSNGLNYNSVGHHVDNTYEPTPKSVYLEQPTSSFV